MRITVRRHIAAAFVGVVSAAMACSAVAGVADKTGRPELTLTVAGAITQQCGLHSIQSAALGDLTRPGLTADADLDLKCNVPFAVVVRSLNGGLRNTQHPDGLGPYSGSRGYQMTFQMTVQTPQAETISSSYSADELVSGKTISSDGGVAFNGAHIHLDLDNVPAPGLAAGDYSETIELSISPTI